MISHSYKLWEQLAEGVGFEPTVSFPTPVFKTGAIVRSAIPPRCGPKSSLASSPRRASYTIASAPMYGRSAAGVSIDPSSRWYVSSTAMITRGSASPEPFSVCGYCGRAPASGR